MANKKQAVVEVEAEASVEAPAKGKLVRYWAPRNAAYAVATAGGLIRFEDHILILDPVSQADVVAELERSQGYRTAFYRVTNEAGDMDYQEKFMAYLGKLIPQDPADQVSTEQGLLSLLSLFSNDELAKNGISRGQARARKERLVMLAYQTKKVEGLV